MKKGTLSEKVIEAFRNQKTITGEKMNKICNGGGKNTCGIIRSLKDRGYDIQITKEDDGLYIKYYTLVGYTKPFYLICRDIEANYPKIVKTIRFLYNTASRGTKKNT